jgi:hypothetical protein
VIGRRPSECRAGGRGTRARDSRRLTAGLAVVADKDEHLDLGVGFVDYHLVSRLIWAQDHPELKSFRFALAAPQAGAGAEGGKQ